MGTATKVLSLVIAVLLLGLVITTAVSMHKVQTLSLPIAKATTIGTLLLPILTGLSLQSGRSLARRSRQPFLTTDNPLSWTAIVVFVIFTIYETVIATLSASNMGPLSALTCPLEQKWQQLFHNKDNTAIKRIQDAHHCCGLHSTVDRAWPFPEKHRTAAVCHETFGRDRSCFEYWRRDQQIAAGLLLFVAAMSFGVKVIVFLYVRSRASQSGTRGHLRIGQNGRDGKVIKDRLLGSNQERYRDDPSEDDRHAVNHGQRRAIAGGDGEGNDTQQHGPVLQASRTQERESDQNAWA